jgi:serine/threonine protein kinase/Tol biopolymer transport system component
MTLAAGTRLGPYEVGAPLGAGGMGEVYRARDTRLGRDVAVKVLPSAFSADADRLRRFEQEARAASVLNHPNIIAIHDVGTHDGSPYVVTELLEGESLRERINGVALPPRKAIDYAGQVARGLAAAHDRGIVHRDLKPDNLFVTRDGRVKILDFGLAKLKGIEALTDRETRAAGERGDPGTGAGTVLGTVGYMSPEQVRAQPVDHRSDIFSFGAVLYEMLSGRRAFRGASAVETMNAILKEDPPDLSDTNRTLPPALDRIVGHCLEKNPEERFQSARDIAFDLEALSGQSSLSVSRPAVARPSRWLKPVAVGLAAALAVGAAFLAGRRGTKAPVPEFKPLTFRRGTIDAARFAPDGRTVIYQARWEGNPPEIFSTQPGSPESRSLDLPDTLMSGVSSSGELAVGLRRPGRPGRTLARMPLGGGAPRDVLENANAADWGPDGSSFVVVRRSGSRLRLEFPIGKVLLESSANIVGARVSPDGRLVAFTEHPILGDARGDVAVVDLAGKKTVLAPGWEDLGGLAWSADGREVWFTASNSGANRTLHAVSLSGRQRVVSRLPGNMVLMDVARDGRVLVSHGANHPVIMALVPGATKERDLTWLDYSVATDLSPDGTMLLFSEQGLAGGPQYAVYMRGTDGGPAVRLGKGNAQTFSPDGKWALAIDLATPSQLVLLPTGAGEPRPLPRHGIQDYQGAWWMPDGKGVMFGGTEAGRGSRLYVQDLDGGPPRPVTPEGIIAIDRVVSPDGRYVVAGNDLEGHIYPVAGGEPRPLPGFEPGDVAIHWAGDGQSVFVRKLFEVPAKVWRLDLATGRRVLWKELGPADLAGVRGITAIVISPDTRWYAYTYSSRLSNLYLVEGLR